MRPLKQSSNIYHRFCLTYHESNHSLLVSGVVRSLHSRGKLTHCYCTETRPYNQGSCLTAYELTVDKIPSTLICDDMAAALMRHKPISAIALGADRVAANGDTANKIGTYQLAVLAKYHGVPFYVVAPSTSIDLTIESGDEIVIEERPQREMIMVKDVCLAPEGGCDLGFLKVPQRIILWDLCCSRDFQSHSLVDV